MRILVIEDEEMVRDTIVQSLIKSGHEVIGIGSAEEALPVIKAREDAIDLVICDLQLPGSDGLSLLQYLKNGASAVPFALITAHGALDSAIKALRMGAIDFIPKPFGKTELLSVISKVKASQARSESGASHYLVDALSLSVPADAEKVTAAIERIYRHFAGPLSNLRQPVRLLQSALHHAAFNALRHGSPSPQSIIRLSATLDTECFTMTVKDSGRGFKHENYTDRDKAPTGPRGINIIMSAVSEASWHYDNGTLVIMRQALDS